MNKCVVFTCITASKDTLQEEQVTGGADFVAFLPADSVIQSTTWKIRSACDLFTDPRRNARQHKLLAHHYFPEYEYSLWMDGPAQLRVPVQTLIDTFLKDADIAVFSHPERICLYDEAEKCAAWKLEDPLVLANQRLRYEWLGYPKNAGLFETGLLLRRHTPEVATFNNLWWSELCRHSKRDQVSFPYCLKQSGVKHTIIPGTIKTNLNRPGNPYFLYGEHAN